MGIHHITAVGKDMKFYSQKLKLKLVKKTVNFDDPYTYHIYFGDERGSPGTALTFFLWDIPRARKGVGEVSTIMYGAQDLGHWNEALRDLKPEFSERFSEKILSFTDPNGMMIEIVEAEKHAWGKFYGALLEVEEFDPRILELLGYKKIKQEGNFIRFKGDDVIDIKFSPNETPSVLGIGSVHHIAFNAKDDAEQMMLREQLVAMGLHVTPQIERKYFRSIYFRVPGGVLFEIATAGPGFLIDEDKEQLGKNLMLPQQYASRKEDILQHLPELDL